MKILDVPSSGSIQGVTYSHNRAGQYKRNRRAPVVPTRTPKQGILRGRFGAASAAWQTLTATVQAAWTAFAAAYPIVDSLGQTVVLTGHQYFVGVSTALQNAGQAIITTPPTNTTVNPVSGFLGAAYDDGTLVVSINPATMGDFVLLAASSVKSGGVSFNRQFSQFGVCPADDQGMDLSDAFTAQYGIAPIGKNIFVKPTPVNSSGMNTPGAVYRVAVAGAPPFAAPVLVKTMAVLSITGGLPATGNALLYIDNFDGTGTQLEEVTLVAGAGTFVTAATAGNNYWARTSDGVGFSSKSNIIAG